MNLLKELKEIVMENLPPETQVTSVEMEGPEVAIYTKNPKAFFENENFVAKIASQLKKRVNIRTDKSLLLEEEKARKLIEKIIPADAGVKDISFSTAFSEVVIEAMKPGVVIGKRGETSKQIIIETGWTPQIIRSPTSDSEILKGIRRHLAKYSSERKKILTETAKKIYREVKSKNGWVRVTPLGGFRQVGRSCILLETPETKVILDCGINVASQEKPYPYLDALNFPIDQLDALIISHAHVDHSGFVPYLYKMGYRGPLYCSVDYEEPVMIREDGNIKVVKMGELSDKLIADSEKVAKENYYEYVKAEPKKIIEVPAFSSKDYKVSFKPINAVIRHKIIDGDQLFEIKTKTGRTVKVTGSHSVFVLKNGKIKEAKVDELKIGDYLVAPQKLPTQKQNVIDLSQVVGKYVNRNIKIIENKLITKQAKSVPATINASPELMRILGYFASEGNLEKRAIRFSFGYKDEELVDDLIKCVKNVFDFEAKQSRHNGNLIRVSVNSVIVREIFSKIFFKYYKKATTKHVPEIVFNVSNELKKEFLSAYFKGDGTVNLLNKTTHAVTVSKKLVSDLTFLCSQLGMTYTLFSRKEPTAKTNNMAHRIIINLSEFTNKNQQRRSCDIIPLQETGFNDEWYYHRFKNRKHATKQRIKNLIEKGLIVNTNNSTILIQEGLLKLANSDLSFLPITQINKVEPTNGYVYDFSVDKDQNFVGGQAPICLHNTSPTRDLMTLLQFDYIDVAVKENKEPPYSEKDVKEMLKHVITREYREVTDIAPDMKLTFHNAAHILGSASVHLHIGEGGHNLVYSLDWKTPITVFDKEDRMHIMEIGKLVDKQVKKYGTGTGFVEEASNFEGWKTIAFNPQTLKSEIVEITSFLKHPINEDLFEIKTKTGRKTIVTGSHSVFTVRNGEVVDIKAKDLNLSDYIVGSKKILLNEKEIVIDLPENKFALKFENENLKNKLSEIETNAKKIFGKKHLKIMLWANDHFEQGMYENAVAKKYHASEKTVRKYFKLLGIEKNPRVKTVFPKKIKITNDFARFLGLYVAEGSFYENTVIVSQYDKAVLEDCLQIIKNNLNLNGKIWKNDAHFYSKQLKLLLTNILECGKGAYNKRVPKQLSLAPTNIVGEFLKGYFIGDGSLRIRKKGISINCASKSELLIQDIGFLLLRLGITPTFEYNNSSKMHNLHIYGIDQIDTFFKHVKIEEWENKYLAQPKQKTKSHFANRIPIKVLSESTQNVLSKTAYQNAKSCGTLMLMKTSNNELEKKLMKSDLMLDEIIGIRKVKSSSEFVYDFSVKGFENFLGGWGHLFMHNSGDVKYGFTRLFDNIDLHYPRIETLILESTYGTKKEPWPMREEVEEKLLRFIKETLAREGNALIPVFSVGRAQEIMLIIEEFYRRGRIPADTRVYIDGMTREASAIHTAYPEYLRQGVERRILTNDSPFTSDLFQVVDWKERDKIISEKGGIIIASSGMLTGGPSLYYFQKMAERMENTLIFVGYQGEGSLGRRIQMGLSSMPVMENGKTKELKINMKVETIEGLSGHSDRTELTNYIRSLNPKPKRILVDHGEKTVAIDFAKYVSSRFHINTTAPRNLDSVRLK